MDSVSALFYVFSAILLLASLRVITARSTVHAALYLVLAFFSASCLWMLLRAEFLAIALVLVYVGAVMVLFLFVVMMLDVNTDKLREGFWTHLPLAGFVGALIALEMALVLMRGFRGQAPAATARELQLGNTKLLGIEIYTNYLYPMQLAAVLLLVAIIAAIALTLRGRKDSKHLEASQQVRVKKADRLRIVKMAPVRGEHPEMESATVDALANQGPTAGTQMPAKPGGDPAGGPDGKGTPASGGPHGGSVVGTGAAGGSGTAGSGMGTGSAPIGGQTKP